jgi:type IV secretory pathway TrbL component
VLSSWLRWLLCVLVLLVPLLAMAQDMPDLFPNPDPDAVDPNQLTDEFWSTGIFTEMIALIAGAFAEGEELQETVDVALSVLHWLAVLEVALVLVGLALSDNKQGIISVMCGQLILIGFIVELISKFPTYTAAWTDGCLWVGLTVAGTLAAAMGSTPMTIAEFKDVGFVMLRGLTRLNQPYDYVFASFHSLSWIGVIKGTVFWGPMMVALLCAAACFFLIGVQVLYTFVRAWLLSAVAIPFLALIILKQTRAIGMSMLYMVVGEGTKLCTLASIVSLMDGVLNRVAVIDPENLTIGTCIAVAILGLLFLMLAGWLPAKVADRISGSSGSLGTGRIVVQG